MKEMVAFMCMSDSEQFVFLHQRGVYLMNHDTKNFVRCLYACKNFFVEISYRRDDTDMLMVSVFQDVSLLDDYLILISIEDWKYHS